MFGLQCLVLLPVEEEVVPSVVRGGERLPGPGCAHWRFPADATFVGLAGRLCFRTPGSLVGDGDRLCAEDRSSPFFRCWPGF